MPLAYLGKSASYVRPCIGLKLKEGICLWIPLQLRDAPFPQIKTRRHQPSLAVSDGAAALPEARGPALGSSQFGPGLALAERGQNTDPRQRSDAGPPPQGSGRGLVCCKFSVRVRHVFSFGMRHL